MQIDHTALDDKTTSFKTSVDGQAKFETFLDFMNTEWYTCAVGDDSKILLEGRIDPSIPEDQMVEAIKPSIDEAIGAGKL